MNKVIIIGNLTRDPEKRTMDDGTACATFSVAVNRRVRSGQHPEADYFRVTAWRQLGELCEKYLSKGRKVMVEGSVRAHAYTDNRGDARASLEVVAENVEFLTPRGQESAEEAAEEKTDENGFTEVEDDEIPF